MYNMTPAVYTSGHRKANFPTVYVITWGRKLTNPLLGTVGTGYTRLLLHRESEGAFPDD